MPVRGPARYSPHVSARLFRAVCVRVQFHPRPCLRNLQPSWLHDVVGVTITWNGVPGDPFLALCLNPKSHSLNRSHQDVIRAIVRSPTGRGADILASSANSFTTAVGGSSSSSSADGSPTNTEAVGKPKATADEDPGKTSDLKVGAAVKSTLFVCSYYLPVPPLRLAPSL